MSKRKIFLTIAVVVAIIFGGYLLTKTTKLQAPSIQPIGQMDQVVSADWLDANLNNPNLRLVFAGSGKDKVEIYDQGHIRNSIYSDVGLWYEDKTKTGSAAGIVSSKEKFEKLMGEQGISNDNTVVLYGTPGAAYILRAFWTFKYHGHENIAYLNGGITEWVRQKSKESLVKDSPEIVPAVYKSTTQDNLRITADELYKNLNNPNIVIIDARTSEEYSGQKIAEKVSRGGHIPGAVNMEWYKSTINPDNETLKSKEELELIYKDVPKNKEIVVYCQSGTRSSNTFFALKYILGYSNVRNYDGSWDEWSNIKNPDGTFKYSVETE